MRRVPEPVTILVIDDDENIAELARTILEKAGYLVETVGSAEAGIERLRHPKATLPAAMLLDGMLPGLDGGELLKEVARDTTIPSIPTILMSDLIDLDATSVPSARVKIAGRLDKPFTADKLLSMVATAVAS